jgi:beta-lactamase class A
MSLYVSRREFIAVSIAAPFLGRLAPPLLPDAFEAIERRVGGRLGVATLDTGSGKRLAHRSEERFPMCSTFKFPLVALVLRRVDSGCEDLDRMIPYAAADLQAYAPITRAHVNEGALSVSALCEAAVDYSDNTAANLLVAAVGGPVEVTSFARSIGDRVTRLDRTEPALNESAPGDPRDTTSPAAMLHSLEAILLGRVLSRANRRRLTDWLTANTTGNSRLRAGVPAGWRVGDKTGSGPHGSTNDIGILWPPNRAPILVAAYLTETEAAEADRNHALAEVARIAATL